eukprot:TRINITY_DN5497_c0_g1_i1.p1 TRINITY_DN5497_c0_g1~~TRINITY_DN5497_c0_g1_i1.p1  ORF type:complete len:1046 (+),score=282.78 TRINITY_DN5497_c0_g1_i1:103-3138(+)
MWLHKLYGVGARSTRGVLASPLSTACSQRFISTGDRVHGFTVESRQPIPGRSMEMLHLRHDKTKAELVHVDAPADKNNTFSVIFKTVPQDSRGVAHILEHVALCGSQKYPVRDPFFNMLRRSLSSYMNAWTGADFTMYPFCTQHERDYQNLLSVYLDAAFRPLIRKLDFMQEGHRLELVDEADPSKGVQRHGVVYNEMKGALGDSTSLFYEELTRALYSNTTYQHCSGGLPSDIPKLTHKDLLDFHHTHYHPSNSRFFTYGSLDIEPVLETIDSVISEFSPLPSDVMEGLRVGSEERWDEPREKHMYGPLNPALDAGAQEQLALAVLCNDVVDTHLTFKMMVLSHLLLNGPNAPFHKALLQTNIGQDYSPGAGYCPRMKESMFSVGLLNIRDEDCERVKSIVENTLKEVVEDDIDPERIEAFLHQLEIDQKHIKGNFGLQLAGGIVSSWIHDAAPMALIDAETHITMLREELKEHPRLFQELTRDMLLNNTHRMWLRMSPDPEFGAKAEQEEQEELSKIDISDHFANELREDKKALEAHQDEVEDISVLPTMTLEDIADEAEDVVFLEKSDSGLTSFQFPQLSNGLVYVRMLSNLSELDPALRPYLPLFCDLVTKMGTEEQSYQKLSQSIEAQTGGIDLTPYVSPVYDIMPDGVVRRRYDHQTLQVTSMALERNVDAMLGLLREVLTSAKFEDLERLRSIIGMVSSSIQSSIVHSGHEYAINAARARIDPLNAIGEQWNGLTQAGVVLRAAAMDDLTPIAATAADIATEVMREGMFRTSVVAEPGRTEEYEHVLRDLALSVGAPKFEQVALDTEEMEMEEASKHHFVPIPAGVNFVARAYPTVGDDHEDSPGLDILAKVMSQSNLHQSIREKGGAYGGGASGSGRAITFWSYRDPNVEGTLENFDKGIEWVSKGEFTDENLTEAKLSVFSSLDAPVAPSAKGMSTFRSGVTTEFKQRRRDLYRNTSRDNIVELAEKYLQAREKSATVVLGSEKSQASLSPDEWEVKDIGAE